MPRIPPRTEPYTSPARQQRHYKNKRDQTLRNLGRSSYINGSHFAILLVNAKGDVEVHASEVLQCRLDLWFSDAVKQDARNIAIRVSQSRQAAAAAAAASVSPNARRDSSTDMPMPDSAPNETFGVTFLPGVPEDDEGASDEECSSPSPSQHGLYSGSTPRSRGRRGPPKPLPPIDPELANSLLQSHYSNVYAVSEGSDNSGSSSQFLFPESFDADTLESWYTQRFLSLQQETCKIVAKCWIKVIEPKKQTKYPYQRGDSSKPSWWPAGLRHKEPDHLLKAERNTLLFSIVRSDLVRVHKLQLSTQEVQSFIPPEKMAILREIYTVAREDERLRDAAKEITQEHSTNSDDRTIFAPIPLRVHPYGAWMPRGRKRSNESISASSDPGLVRPRQVQRTLGRHAFAQPIEVKEEVHFSPIEATNSPMSPGEAVQFWSHFPSFLPESDSQDGAVAYPITGFNAFDGQGMGEGSVAGNFSASFDCAFPHSAPASQTQFDPFQISHLMPGNGIPQAPAESPASEAPTSGLSFYSEDAHELLYASSATSSSWSLLTDERSLEGPESGAMPESEQSDEKSNSDVTIQAPPSMVSAPEYPFSTEGWLELSDSAIPPSSSD